MSVKGREIAGTASLDSLRDNGLKRGVAEEGPAGLNHRLTDTPRDAAVNYAGLQKEKAKEHRKGYGCSLHEYG